MFAEGVELYVIGEKLAAAASGNLSGNQALSVAETKLDGSIPTNQFLIKGYRTPYRLDISGRSGGLLPYVRNEIPSRLLIQFIFNSDIQVIAVELNLKKNKHLSTDLLHRI